jgi:MYXO-CTERM domain-containing protein
LETTVRRILDTAGAFGEAAWAWWSDLAAEASWPPALGPWLLALIALLLLAALRRRRPPPLEVRPPQLLITQGEVLPEAGPQGPVRRRRRPGDPGAAAAGRLKMTLSNLSRYPVQVLEVALRQESRGAPRVAELEAVVPPLGALELEVRVPLGLAGDGWLDVYCYAAAPRQKLHRHRAELVWEPWVSRFKVAPMEQATAAAKRLASDERSALFELPDPPAEAAVAAPARERAAPPPAREPAAAPAAVPPAVPARGAVSGRPVVGPSRVARVAPRDVATPSDAKPSAAGADDSNAIQAAVKPPAPDATPLGALWARLPKGGAARGAADAREAGERGDARERPEAADAPKRPKLEFPDDF